MTASRSSTATPRVVDDLSLHKVGETACVQQALPGALDTNPLWGRSSPLRRFMFWDKPASSHCLPIAGPELESPSALSITNSQRGSYSE